MAGRSIWYFSSALALLVAASVGAVETTVGAEGDAAQPPVADRLAAPPDPPGPTEITGLFWAVPALADGNIDVHFTALEIVEAIRFLAGEEMNVVTVGDVSQSVSIDLRRVAPGYALDSVLRTLGVAVHIEGNTLFLAPVEDRVLQLPVVIQENSVLWDELDIGIASLLSDQGTVALNKSGGVATVTDRPPALDRLEEHVYQVLQSTTRQVEIEVQVIEAVYEDNEGLGVDWSLLDGVLDPDWGVTGGTVTGDVAFSAPTDTRNTFQVGVLDPGRWSAFLDAYQEQIRLNMISRPRITALSNQPATFEVKEKIPYLTKTVSQEGGVTRTDFALEFDEAGIEVQVVAAVAEGGEIAMEVHPIISTVVGFTASLPDLGPQPIIDTRETKSLVRLSEGSSLLMSGLMQDRENVSSLGVPVLSHIPWLGRLFRSEQVRTDKTEIIIVLTPRSRRGPGVASLERHGRVARADVRPADDTLTTRLAAARADRAWEALMAGDAARALVAARSAASVRPSTWWTLNNVGLAQQQAGFLGDAERSLRTAVRATTPASPVALTNWGTVLLHRGRAAEAVEPLRDAAARARRGRLHDEALLAWALALEMSGRGSEALDVLEHEAGGTEGPLGHRVAPRVARILAAMETASLQ